MFDKRKEPQPVRKDNDPVMAPPEPLPNPTTTAQHTVRTTAVIGATITIKGDVTGEENLVIEGKVDGTVSLPSNDVTVGETGHVSADVSASIVRIDGEVKGDIQGVEKVVISKTGLVKGNIVAPRVTLEDGAKFKGSIDMDPSESKSSNAGSSAGKASSTSSMPPAPAKPKPFEPSTGKVSGKSTGTTG